MRVIDKCTCMCITFQGVAVDLEAEGGAPVPCFELFLRLMREDKSVAAQSCSHRYHSIHVPKTSTTS